MKDERFFWGDLHPVCVLRGLLYNLWVLILAVLTAWLCVEGYHLFTYHPVYTASATVAVNVKGGTSAYTSLDLTARMAQVFASVFQSDTFREAAQCDVVASVLPETNLIHVQVTAENPRESFLSLKNVLENHADLTDELFSNAELRVIRDPQVPLAPSNPVDLKPYRMRACVGAMLAASLIVSVLFLRRDTVQTPQAARHKLDGRVLGIIGHERKEKRLFVKKSRGAGRKAAALLTDPFVRYTYTEAYQDLCAALEHRMRRDGKKVLLLTGAGENEGKSSVAANLALALSMRGRHVLLLDLDLRKPALHKIFGLRTAAKNGIGQYLQAEKDAEPPLIFSEKYGISLGLTAPAAHPERLLHSEKLKKLLLAARADERFDYVLLDSPPMLLSADAEALSALSDLSVLVVRQDYTPAGILNDCADALTQSGTDFAGFILNDFYAAVHPQQLFAVRAASSK